MKGIENILRSAAEAYERAKKSRVRMHPSAAEAYERAQKPGVRMHAGPAKEYESPEKPGVRMHAGPVKAYERAKNHRVRMHAGPAKAYERAQKLGVRMHAGPAKAYERAQKTRSSYASQLSNRIPAHSSLARETWREICVSVADIFHMQISRIGRGLMRETLSYQLFIPAHKCVWLHTHRKLMHETGSG